MSNTAQARKTRHIRICDLLGYRKGQHKAILVLQAYFDESGDRDKPFVCMAGCIADSKAWDQFEVEWAEILAKFNVNELHMAQLMAYEPQEKYKGWGRDKADTFLAELLPIVERTVSLYIATSENMFEHALVKEWQRHPYFNCLVTCIDGAASYAMQFGPDEKVEMFFADHPEHGSQARSLYPEVRTISGYRDRLGPDAYGSPVDILPLQAADMVAWLYRREVERAAKGCKWPMSDHLSRIKDKNWYNRGYFTFDQWKAKS